MSNWVYTGNTWRHRPWWKVWINTVLRAIQPWPWKLIVYTKCDGPGLSLDANVADDPRREPVVLGYGVGLVLHGRVT